MLPKHSLLILIFQFSEHTQDKHIQRDDEYYDGDNDNDQMDVSWSKPGFCFLFVGGVTILRLKENVIRHKHLDVPRKL